MHSLGHSDRSNISSPVPKNIIKKFQLNAKKKRVFPTNSEKIFHPETTQKTDPKGKKGDQNVISQVFPPKQTLKMSLNVWKLHSKGATIEKRSPTATKIR